MRIALALLIALAMTGCGTIPLPELQDIDIPVVLPPQGEQPDAGGWATESERVRFDPSRLGAVEMQTLGIVAQPGRNADGGWEYMILTLHGDGFDRVLLFQVGGGRKAIRFKVGTQPAQNNVCSDNLPDAHTWRVEWGDGSMRVLLDGRQVGHDEDFNGAPSSAIFGGYDDSRRDFKGSWRNGKVVTQ